jgi:formate dehydrogenase iron-sulfur subunit
MDQTEEYGTLVIFTTLAPLAVGGLIGLLVTGPISNQAAINWGSMVVFITGFLALVVSVLHLGRPWRAPLALSRLSTSWLSREVLLFGLFLIILGCYTILPLFSLSSQTLNFFGILGGIIGIAGTLATGMTYHLRSRPSWDQWLSVISFPLGAISTGALFGLFVARQFYSFSGNPRYLWAILTLFLLLSVIVTWVRSTRPSSSEEGYLSTRSALGPNRWLLVLRTVAIMTAVVLIFLGGQVQFYAWVPAFVGEFADRRLFFTTIVPVTLRGRYLSNGQIT